MRHTSKRRPSKEMQEEVGPLDRALLILSECLQTWRWRHPTKTRTMTTLQIRLRSGRLRNLLPSGIQRLSLYQRVIG